MSNASLLNARRAKNDEFYTRYEDIEEELGRYWEELNGKKIYCPCDGRESNFYKYMKDNYDRIGLRGLIITDIHSKTKTTFNGSEEKTEPLKEDGDFRSNETTMIKDNECDMVITNPPFSLMRDFIYWLNDGRFEKREGKYVRI